MKFKTPLSQAHFRMVSSPYGKTLDMLADHFFTICGLYVYGCIRWICESMQYEYTFTYNACERQTIPQLFIFRCHQPQFFFLDKVSHWPRTQTRQTCQQGPGILLALPPQCWVDKHTPPHLVFSLPYVVF